MPATTDTVRAIFANSGFEPEDPGAWEGLCFTSREGGNGTDCEPAPETLEAARALRKRVRAEVPGATGATVAIDVCDEWVMVCVTLPK